MMDTEHLGRTMLGTICTIPSLNATMGSAFQITWTNCAAPTKMGKNICQRKQSKVGGWVLLQKNEKKRKVR